MGKGEVNGAAIRTRPSSPRPARWLRLIIPGLLLVLLLTGKLVQPPLVLQVQRAASDFLQRLYPRPFADAPLRIVEIDDESLARYGQWPWPRSLLADLLDHLRERGAALAVIGMILAEPDRASPAHLLESAGLSARLRDAGIDPKDLPDGDASLARAMGEIPTILGFAFSDDQTPVVPLHRPAGIGVSGVDPKPYLRSYRGMVRDLPELEAAAAGYGSLNGLTDGDGVERRMPLFSTAFGEIYPSLVAETLRVLTGATDYRLKTAGGSGERSFGAETGLVAMRVGEGADGITVPTDSAGAVGLHLAQPTAQRSIPAWRVLDGSLPADAVDGRIVILAVSAKGVADLRPTAARPRPSFTLHAEALEQILLGDFLERPDWADGAELVLVLVLGLGLILLSPRMGPLGSAVFAVVLIAGLLGASSYAFVRLHLQLDAVYPSLSLTLLFIAITVQSYFVADRERAFIRGAFGRYLSPELVAELAANPEQLRLGGERRDLTFLFTDIAGFTTLSEELGPVALAPILNQYFDGACTVILKHGGMVNEFVGDAILAFFGAPLTQRDHAIRAVACARELDQFAFDFQREQNRQGITFGLTRIGIHTGTALVGNFGSRLRFKYAALGDVVNTASRIEGLNKYFGTRVCISGVTVETAGATDLRKLGRVIVKGKSQILSIFELPPPERAPYRARYEEAYAAMERGDAEQARDLFRRLHDDDPEDGPVTFQLGRLEQGETGDLIVMADK